MHVPSCFCTVIVASPLHVTVGQQPLQSRSSARHSCVAHHWRLPCTRGTTCDLFPGAVAQTARGASRSWDLACFLRFFSVTPPTTPDSAKSRNRLSQRCQYAGLAPSIRRNCVRPTAGGRCYRFVRKRHCWPAILVLPLVCPERSLTMYLVFDPFLSGRSRGPCIDFPEREFLPFRLPSGNGRPPTRPFCPVGP